MRRTRKPPSLVSMWMLDVFCCALGCVTLLWLLNTRQANDEKHRATEALADLTTTRQTLLDIRDSASTTHRALGAEIESLKSALAGMTREKNDLAKKYANAVEDLASTRDALDLEGRKTVKLTDDLAAKVKDVEKLTAKLATLSTSRDELTKLLERHEATNVELLAKAKSADAKATELDARLAALTKERSDANAKLAVLKKASDDLTMARSTASELQKKIDDAQATIVDLQGQKAKLADRFDRLKLESDTRFAGVAMTGRRAVFIVDMSGSMKLISDKVLAPKKWETVVETVVKVMKSQPELEKYQIVIFSAKAQYLFGSGEWLGYDGDRTLKAVQEKLLAVDPKGDTNMYEAFDLAFRLKSEGLDTVYLFSDGLPTSGPGLTREMEANMSESQRTEHLSKQMKQALATKWNTGEKRVKINSIGFFYESPEVGAFLWSLSRDNDGSFVGMSRP